MILAVNLFIDIDAQQELCDWVTEIEITDWTKTREPGDITGDEKKLNSHEDLADLNSSISYSEVETIYGLYNSQNDLRDMSALVLMDDRNSDDISGGKILRTLINNNVTVNYNLTTLKNYIKSDMPIAWDENNNITWDVYTSIDESGQRSAVEWRLLNAKFNLTASDIYKIRNEKADLILGIPADNEYGFEMIIPFDDIVNIIVNNRTTSINYCNHNIRNYCINNTVISPKQTTASTSYCDRDYHLTLAQHTAGIHIDTNVRNEINFDCDLSNYIKTGENSLDILIGSIISSEKALRESYGFSKLSLYIIEKPKINISAKFYKYDLEGEIIYFDSTYLPKKDESVYLQIDIVNNSNMPIKNNDLNLWISRTNKININKTTAKYNSTNIMASTRCYLNDDFSQEYTVSSMEIIEPRQKLSIVSDQIRYTILRNDCIEGYVWVQGQMSSNYIRDKLTHIELKQNSTTSSDKRIKIKVSELTGRLNISYEIEGRQLEDELLVEIKNSDYLSGVAVGENEVCRVDNIPIRQEFFVKPVVPYGFELVSINNSSVTFSTSYCEADVLIRIRCKGANYFSADSQINRDLLLGH